MKWRGIAFGALGFVLGCGQVVRMDDFGETPEDYGGGGGGGETGISWGDSGDGGEWAETGGFGGCPDGRTPSAETCASSADEDCNGVDCALWSQGFRVISPVSRIKTDVYGNVYVFGQSGSMADFGAGPLAAAGGNDLLVAKFDALGSHLWSRRFGDTGDQLAADLAIDAGGNVLLGGSFNGSLDFGKGVSITASGNLHKDAFVAGYYAGSLDLGAGPLTSVGAQDVFLTKRNRLCQEVWSKSFGSEGNEYAADLAITAAGDVYLTMSTQGSIDMGGGPLQALGNADAVIAKYDGRGNHLWSRLFGDPYQQDVPHLATAGVTAVVSFTNTGIVDLGYGETLSGLVLGSFAP